MADVEQMRKRQQVLADFGEFALRSDDLDAVLTQACRLVGDALGTGRSKILEIENGGECLFVRAGVGWAPDIVGRLRMPMGEHTSETYSIDQGGPVVTRDIRKEDRFKLPDFLKDAGVVALVNTPIFLPGGKPFGLLQVDATEPRDFGEDDIQFLRTYTAILGPVIDRLLKLQELRSGEERFRLVVETARDYAIFLSDAEDKITDWFPGAEAVFGWTAEEAIGQPASILFTPEDRERGAPEREVETARREGWAPDVRWHLGKDGSRVFIDGVRRALRDSSGALSGFFKIGQDVTERRQGEAALRESEERFRTLATHIPQLVFRSLGTGERTWGSPQWEAFTGLSDIRSRGLGWLDAIHPDDREATMKAWREAEARGEYYVEHRTRSRNGDYRWHQTRAAPLPDETGRVLEWLGTSADIHGLRQLQERQSILMAELQHRTRNLIAVVHSIARQTLANSNTLATFEEQFDDRLSALARVQGLLSRSDRKAITIGAVIRLELDALGAGAVSEQVKVEGPEARIRKGSVQTLALAIHELATNARKHGALSTANGRLTVTWRTYRAEGQELRLALDWVEEGITVDENAGSARRGYGRELIEEALPYALDATTRYALTKDMLHCAIDLPLTDGMEHEDG